MKKITVLKKILEKNDSHKLRSYSGRAMYGKECVGIVTDDLVPLVAEIAANVHEVSDGEYTHDDFFSNYRTDNMGIDTILYFPKIKWEEEQKEIECDFCNDTFISSEITRCNNCHENYCEECKDSLHYEECV